jgi:tetratricopeptide (TPR) repeat protein
VNRTDQELVQILAQARKMPEGDARIALLEDLVRHADASGNPRLPFDARSELTSAYQHGGETAKAFVTFSWCLAAYDRDPGGFNEHDDWLLRWQYKWTVAALKRFPEVPLDRSHRALEDMERRYLAGGHSLHAVYTLRCEIADHVGDLEQAEEWHRKWTTAPRDENSDCVACDPTNKVYHLVLRGRDEEAVAVADPVLDGRITCTVQPQSIQAALLLPYLRTGRLDEAREAHRKSYRAIRGNRDYLDDLGRHLYFCAVTGNEPHGLELLERHLDWLDRPADPMALLETAGSAALLLRRLRETGHGGQRIRRPGFGDRPASEPDMSELDDELRAVADGLARRFDERNGTDFQSRLLAEKLAAEPVVEYLALSRTRRRRPGGFVGQNGRAAPVPDVVTDRDDGPDPTNLGQLTPEGLLDVAEESYRQGHGDRARAALRRFDELAPDPGAAASAEPGSASAVRRADLRGTEQAEAGDLSAAERTWRTVAERYAALGDGPRRQVALGRVGMVCLRTDRVAEGMELIADSARYLREHGTPRQRVKAQERLALGYAGVGEPEHALELLDELAVDEAAREVLSAADLALARGMALAALGPPRLADAVARLADARDGYRVAGDLRQYAFASLQYGRLVAAESRVADAAEAFAEAAVHGGHDPELRATALAMRGGLLARAGDAAGGDVADVVPDAAEQAVDDLVEAVAIYTGQGRPEALYARFDLALVLASTGRLLDAAETAEEALSGLERLPDPDSAASFRELLVGLYRGLGEKEEALRQADALVEYLADGPADALGRAYETAGELRDELDHDAVAAERFGAAAQAYRQAGDQLAEVRATRRRALSLHWSGETEAGLAVAVDVERLIDSLPDIEPEQRAWERAALDYNRAKMLAGMGRAEEAVARAGDAAAGFRRAGHPDDAQYADELVIQITAQSSD